ncbi:hypothetical protein DVH24_000516 [Malus domestica]|uniref:Uncharacterized protein n=1 Tax=Malus domestica TaxID=3750 RepID=A0A498J2V0_MALDO|nr:hypothetical protein DVH24_000516 [Malus domestica]
MADDRIKEEHGRGIPSGVEEMSGSERKLGRDNRAVIQDRYGWESWCKIGTAGSHGDRSRAAENQQAGSTIPTEVLKRLVLAVV